MMNFRCGWGGLALAASLGAAPVAQAAPLKVLWYSYADQASEYKEKISLLADSVQTLPSGTGQAWNLTYFGPGSAAPNFSRYDVLVVQSGEAFRTGAPGAPNARPDYSGILGNKAAIASARGDRTFLTGADSDFHAVRGDTGNIAFPAKCSPSITAPACWDGALGHSVNAVNWAGNGNGMGVVSFLDGEFPGSFWWTKQDSFLRQELLGNVGYGGHDQHALFDARGAALPLNAGLSSQGLSNWNLSFHAFFKDSTPGYTQVVDSTALPGWALAIATSGTAAGARSAPVMLPQVDEPAMPLMLALGLATLGVIRRRRGRSVAPH
ncbi:MULTISPECIES: hypothetical protein [unclassified Janthinobacterium]|uniref:hypothetical protein n=1 Tax=unclassified Janthinobacterium TaxID=2610881 RepID=UPI000561F58F|nr:MULTISPECIES: hypothetical protein [unclassified Janthinobacterium]MEC5163568.1 hypothetical protein [Janthinobacterium sp. CG_S6]